MTLYTAINQPGTGASMRRALKVLAKEWRRRGVLPDVEAELHVRHLHACVDASPEAQRARQETHTYLVQNMPLSLLQRQLTKLGACEESIAWAGQFSTARQAWEACADEFEMLSWLLRFGGVRLREEGYYALRGTCINSPEACAAIRRVVPFERLRELSREK
jgi:hypothetical protein